MTTMNPIPEIAPEAFEAHSQKIWICKTNIATKKDLKKIGEKLASLPAITKWSIDRDDSDKVLRVVSEGLLLEELINIVSEAGFTCEELPD